MENDTSPLLTTPRIDAELSELEAESSSNRNIRRTKALQALRYLIEEFPTVEPRPHQLIRAAIKRAQSFAPSVTFGNEPTEIGVLRIALRDICLDLLLWDVNGNIIPCEINCGDLIINTYRRSPDDRLLITIKSAPNSEMMGTLIAGYSIHKNLDTPEYPTMVGVVARGRDTRDDLPLHP